MVLYPCGGGFCLGGTTGGWLLEFFSAMAELRRPPRRELKSPFFALAGAGVAAGELGAGDAVCCD